MKIQKIAGYVIVAVLLVMLMGLLVVSQGEQPSTETPATPTAVLPTTMPTVTPPVAASVLQTQTMDQEIALCTFVSQTQAPPATLPLDAFAFSEPQVVLTSSTQIVLLEWISDTQSLLFHNHPIADSPKEIIATFNLQTGEWKRYAEAQLKTDSVWVPTAQGVMFTERLPDGQHVLRLSHGIDQPFVDLVTDLPERSVVRIDSTGQMLLSYYIPGNPHSQIASVSLAEPLRSATILEAIDFKLEIWSNLALSPNGSQAAIHNREGFYLLDRITGELCQLDLGQVGQYQRRGFWPEWSTDERYMALLTTYGQQEMIQVTDLVVIDMLTGQQRYIDFGGKHAGHIQYWLPDTYTFLVAVPVPLRPGSAFKHLYLVDAVTGEFKHILPDHQFLMGEQLALEWTADEKAIFVPCGQERDKNYNERRICRIPVEVQR
jgi:hypothetical protein